MSLGWAMSIAHLLVGLQNLETISLRVAFTSLHRSSVFSSEIDHLDAVLGLPTKSLSNKNNHSEHSKASNFSSLSNNPKAI
jgi:hypothetical protein